MAINKVVNKSTKSHGAMRNAIEYVLQDKKVKEGYVTVTGPYLPNVINWDGVYNTFLDEKRLWNKDSGRMYAHNIISFHKDEKVTPEEVLDIGKAFCEKFFAGYQCLITVHQDRDHLHCHIVTNSVSYIDGMKLHQNHSDLERQKAFTNELCKERGLTVAEKGKHFDGSIIEKGEVTAWSKDKYNLLKHDEKRSFLADCGLAVVTAIEKSVSQEEFIRSMEDQGWHTTWNNRKHITFENDKGEKVRDSNLSKTFNMDISKEGLLNEFARQATERAAAEEYKRRRAEQEQADLERYYREVEAADAGLSAADAVRNDSEATGELNRKGHKDTITSGLADRSGKSESDAFLRELAAQERASEEKLDYSQSERKAREAERIRLDSEAERRARDAEREAEERKERGRKIGIRHGSSR